MVSGKAYAFFVFGYSWQEIPGEILHFGSYLWRNYFGIGVILGIAGIVRLWRKSPAWMFGLLLMFIANAFFFVNYRVLDKDTMFLPAYLVWAVFIAGGFEAFDKLLEYIRDWGLPELWGKNIGRILPIVFALLGLSLNWPWVDMSKADSLSLFAKGMISAAAPQSIVIAPWSPAVVLEYYQVVENQRPDILIVNDSRRSVARYYELWKKGIPHTEIMESINAEEVEFINQNIQHKTIYAVDYDPVLANKFEYLPDGPVFKLAMPKSFSP